jgi:Ni2+-binding GTPase involved in maturation of urease and hydrogenase
VVGIVVIARGEGIKAARKTINGRVEAKVVIVRKDDVEVSVELSGSEFAETFRYESDADEVGLCALE